MLVQVETGKMSAVETGQMSAAETGQMSSVARADICFVTTHNADVSEVSTVPMLMSQKSQLWQCGNVTMFKSQIGDLTLNRRKWPEMGPE